MKHKSGCICVKCEDLRIQSRTEAGEMGIELARFMVRQPQGTDWPNYYMGMKRMAQAILDKLEGK